MESNHNGLIASGLKPKEAEGFLGDLLWLEDAIDEALKSPSDYYPEDQEMGGVLILSWRLSRVYDESRRTDSMTTIEMLRRLHTRIRGRRNSIASNHPDLCQVRRGGVYESFIWCNGASDPYGYLVWTGSQILCLIPSEFNRYFAPYKKRKSTRKRRRQE
jgi:hypothetical protein